MSRSRFSWEPGCTAVTVYVGISSVYRPTHQILVGYASIYSYFLTHSQSRGDNNLNVWPFDPSPQCLGSSPFRVHLHPATKENIWRGEYIDLFSLLSRALESVRALGWGWSSQRSKVERNWVGGHTIYMALVV